ncbi:MAG: helix-turn-helix transcriptional regulator [Lachnospiraceae bacterium]|nr:helix-turn-helix transcriptional regulator [Lachnospiraceae bacterium]
MKPNYTNLPKRTTGILNLLVCFFVTFAILSAITLCFYHTSQEEISNDRTSFINNYSQITDRKIDIELHDYSHGALSRSVSLLNKPAAFFEDPTSDSITPYDIRLDLFNHLLIETMFNDVILYRTYDDSFVSAARAGYSLNEVYLQSNNSNYADLHELISLPSQSIPMFYLTENSRLYYFYPVHRQIDIYQDSYAGFFAIWLDEDTFFHVDSLEMQSNGTTLIIDGDNIIYASGKNILSNEAILNIISESAASNSNQLYQTLFSTEYAFYISKSNESDLTYLYYEPVSSTKDLLLDLDNPSTIMYWLCCIAVIATAVLFFIITHIKRSHSKSTTEKTHNSDESYLFKNTYDLLYGISGFNTLDEALHHIIKSNTLYKYTSCIVVEPEPLTILKMPLDQRHDFAEGITESLKMHLDNTADIFYTLMPYPNNQLTCIINSNNFMPENLALNILEHLSGVYDCKFNVFCTIPAVSLDDISRNYNIIISGQKYSYIYKYNNLLTQDTLEQLETNNALIDSGLTNKLQDFLNNELFDDLQQYIRTLPNIMRQRGFSYIRIKDHYLTIFAVIHSYCKANQKDYRYKDMPLSDIIGQFDSIDECSTFLCEEIALLASHIEELKNAHDNAPSKRYIDQITEYIDENILIISLSMTAEYFNISAAHLSRVFKEHTGINFSDYVADKKLQKAAWLLANEKDMPISDIARNLGYNTPAYFSRKFKEHYNTTPAAYRKEHLNDN